MRIIALFLCLFFNAFAEAQSISDFKKLTCPEKRWVIFHPFVAKKAFRITNEARLESKKMETDTRLDGDADGGQVDAFRHSYWMARLSQEMCWRKARSLGRAHEKGNYRDFKKNKAGEEAFSDSVAGVMDLHNNQQGISVGQNNKALSSEELKLLIVQSIQRGEMKIIRKDENGNSLDCNGNILDLEKYTGVWNIPRCLVSSSY
jgi:hypothetical protein